MRPLSAGGDPGPLVQSSLVYIINLYLGSKFMVALEHHSLY